LVTVFCFALVLPEQCSSFLISGLCSSSFWYSC